LADLVSVKFAIQFGAMAIGAAVVSLLIASDLFIRALFAWAAVAFAVVAAAYASNKPRLLMKRQDGSQPIRAWLVLWPYLLLTHFSFWLYRVTHARTVPYAEVVPGLWFSRRLTPSEARDAGVHWAGVLDLAAEFSRASVTTETYHSLPMLDGGVPTEAQMNEATEWVGNQLKQGPVLIHCALGHGRTGCVVLAWMLSQGHVRDVDSGVQRLRALRSGFGLSASQAESITQLTAVPPVR
jgi:protein-tyrosine phosphatase